MDYENQTINIRTSTNILNNSFDLLYSTIDILKRFDDSKSISNNPIELKVAIISIASSVELLLKAKIASIDWKQLFIEPKDANLELLNNGKIFSLGFNKCLKRIEKNSNILFDKLTKAKIDKIRIIRNKIAHLHFEANEENYATLISIGLDFFIEFYRNYILLDFHEEVDRTKNINEELKKIQEFVKQRLLTFSEKYKMHLKPKTYYFSECNNCYQDSFIIYNEHVVKCVYCNNENLIKEVAQFHSTFDVEPKKCPECNLNSMASIHKKEDEEEAWDCVICGYFINKPRQWIISIDGNLRSKNSIKI